MPRHTTTVAGIEIPSTDPVFLSIVAVHVLFGIVCVVAGASAMLAAKRPGRHPTSGTIYFWALAAVFVTATALSIMRWAENYHLFVLGMMAFAAALVGRAARRQRWSDWARVHIVGMGVSYVLLLTAFYVDNGKHLPLWKDLPHWTYWTLPAVVGLPIIVWALVRHPLARQSPPAEWQLTPVQFLRIAGMVLVLLGVAGLTGVPGQISSVSFFNPPFWINWLHSAFGTVLLLVAFAGGQRLQSALALAAATVGTTLGLTGLLFGRYAARWLDLPELADPSDHLAHLTVGLVASWAWLNRQRARHARRAS